MISKGFLGIDMGNKNIKLVHGKLKGKTVEVYGFDIINTPRDSINDGKILNLNTLYEEIKRSIKKCSLNSNKVILNITGTSVITREIKIPKATDKEIPGILEYEAPQYFPVSLEEYVLDYKILEEVEEEEKTFLRVLLAAVPEVQVQEYIKLAKLLKMDVAAIDIPANSILKYAFFGFEKDPEISQKEEFSVIDIGANTVMMSIFSRGTLMFTRILLKGSSILDEMISNVVNDSYDKSEELKRNKGKIIEDKEIVNATEEEKLLSDAIKPGIVSIFDDINKFIEFYNSRAYGNKVKKIYICGGGGRLDGIDSFVGNYLNISTERIFLENRVQYKGKDRDKFNENYLYLMNAIGSIIR